MSNARVLCPAVFSPNFDCLINKKTWKTIIETILWHVKDQQTRVIYVQNKNESEGKKIGYGKNSPIQRKERRKFVEAKDVKTLE